MLVVDTDTLRPIYGRVTYPPSPNTQIIFTDGVVCREGKAVVLALSTGRTPTTKSQVEI